VKEYPGEKTKAATRVAYCEGTLDVVPSIDLIINDAKLGKVLQEFCKKEHNEENFLFLEACKKIEKKVGAKMVTSGHELQNKAIYETYCSKTAAKQINIKSETRTALEKLAATPAKMAFDDARMEIAKMIKADTLSRFLTAGKAAGTWLILPAGGKFEKPVPPKK
jgi:hypothetical protein